MTINRPGKAGSISTLVVLAVLACTVVGHVCLYLFGDWEEHGWTLRLTLRILWGAWIVVLLATILTRVTIFGWSFRQYFRWPEGGRPAWARFRPSRAPWSKSGKTSFSMTVAMVSITGIVAIAMAVMWILEVVTGAWVSWLVIKILFAAWWVLMITLVLVRVAIFGVQRHRTLAQKNEQLSLTGHDSSESKT